MKTFVALLRGVNVGGRNRVPMSELRASLSALGLEDVVTYVQSGNVVFRTDSEDEHGLAARIEQRVAKDLGVAARVLLRTPAELEKAVSSNPFLIGAEDTSKLHVVFLDAAPTAAAIARLDPEHSPPDEFAVDGKEIYLRLPNGAGRSKLTVDYFERRLEVAATARNWRTLNKLVTLAR